MQKEYTLKEHGFRAIWFEGTTHRDKAIIYMLGAGCSEANTLRASQYLQDAGYSVLCLGFYLWDGLPKEMYRIPVEYVERAVAELKRNGFTQIAIHGISTGAGYALLCASLIPDIRCVLAVVPFDYVMEGVKNNLFPQNCSVYTYRGTDVPCAHFTVLHSNLLKELKIFFKRKDYDLKHLMRYSYDVSDHLEEGRIKVENMHADVLLLGAEKDDCWPSDDAVPRMERILKASNYPYQVKAVVYEKASHALGCEIPDDMRRMKGWILPAEEKYPAECENARKDSFRQILNFLDGWQ